MRLVRIIATAIALVAGLIGAAAVMTIGFLVYVFLRIFGRPARLPEFQRGASRPRPAYSTKDEVIDVTATDVKD